MTASGRSLSYQWRKNGFDLNDSGHIPGTNTATLTINSATVGDAATYDVLVNSACGSIIRNAVTLAFETTPPTIVCPANITQTQTPMSAQPL